MSDFLIVIFLGCCIGGVLGCVFGEVDGYRRGKRDAEAEREYFDNIDPSWGGR